MLGRTGAPRMCAKNFIRSKLPISQKKTNISMYALLYTHVYHM